MLRLSSKSRREFRRRRITMPRLLSIKELRIKRNLKHNKRHRGREKRRSEKSKD